MATLSTGAAGVPISHKRPGSFVQILFGASANGAGGNTRYVLLLGNKTTAGSATVDTEEVLLTGVADAVTYFGEGSELHLMARAAFILAPGATIKAIAVTTATGVAASGTITVGTAATAAGTAYFWIHGVEIAVAVLSGDPVATISANVAAQINAKSSELNVTATSAIDGAGPNYKVTITARHIGTRGNLIKLRKKIVDVGATTFTLSGATLASGTGDDSLTASLTTAATSRHYYYACAHVVTSQLQAIQTQLDTMAGPLVGKRQQAIYATHDTLGTATTQAEALNEERMQGLWANKFETLPCVIAAAWTAKRAVLESQSYSVNLSMKNMDAVDLWPAVMPPPNEADYITDSSANSALDVGLTPLQVRAGDAHPYVVMSITTHSNDSSGNPDTRTLTTNYVTVTDAFGDEFVAWFDSTFTDVKLRDDVTSGDDALPPNTTTPTFIKVGWHAKARELFENLGHIEDLDEDYESWAFNRASGAPNRCNATMGVTPAPWLTQMSARIEQRTPS
jgi:phage tail sheath gpL-like